MVNRVLAARGDSVMSTRRTLKILARAAGVALIVLAIFAAVMVGGYCHATKTIDCVYGSYDEMMGERRAEHLRRWLPSSATDIHFVSKARFGRHEERFSCAVSEPEFVRFAEGHSYAIATNSFIRLDYGQPEQEDSGLRRWRMEREAHDAETQRRLVFGDAPAPERYFSHTESHAFDGGAVGGSWRCVIVFDRDAGRLTGYFSESLL